MTLPKDAAPAPDQPAELKVQAILGRYMAVKAEIQWRAIQRDALVVLTLTFIAALYVGIDKIGAWIMLAPVPLLYVASMWLHHDRRIGFLAGYILTKIEPALKVFDGLDGLDEYLNANDPTRSFNTRHHFSAIMSRLLFPCLQLLTLVTGVGVYIAKGSFTAASVWGVVVATTLVFGVIVLTFVKVKHVRHR